MMIHSENLSGSTASGTLAVNTNSVMQGIIKSVIVSPATGSTTYNVAITNPDGLTVYSKTSNTGDIFEQTELPVRGMYTVTISSASADEAFSIALVLQERQ